MMAVLALATGPAPAFASGGAQGVPGMALVPMTELVVPIVDGDQPNGRLRMKLVLRVADTAAGSRLEAEMPRLRERAIATASEFARLRASPFVAVDARRLADDMAGGLRQGDAAIVSVLLVEVSARRG
jgi:hypothetical protein